ncbi:GntR family transcriptional regulator [Eilatimonas milleporae]|uniref:DNA-binding GntR family transcriptional regulator n=1 Tax=Eilatimonas milleporae TaxID=911205 RepID=A0A3M0CKX8_9PROT|nr:GntR family transcriptional regulator [Eilatimonas milleporae]RMB09040.1 DNA-binding GntR family transcriptional regulator [Eilatimonas milleporae]
MTDTEQHVCNVISDIQSGVLAEDETLSLRKICKLYDVGRSMAKTILETLACEGWIDRVPDGMRGGYVVASTSQATLDQAMELRVILEVYALEKLTPVLTKRLLSRLKQINLSMCGAGRHERFDEAADLDAAFHACIIHAVDTGPLARQICCLGTQQLLKNRTRFSSQEEVFRYVCEHAYLIDAMEMGRTERFLSMCRTHFLGGVEPVRIAAQ